VTGDEAVSVGGRPIVDAADLRAALAAVRMGDVVPVEYVRGGAQRRSVVRVTVTPYETVHAALADLPVVSPAQRAMRRIWIAGGARP
jgi:hypothetical protein